ncbi:hypothetical protein [Lutibacter citreus]|uniref:hypothetical protein n=1 Tax=Lutibacter citreus TaxID=2138210 RepID=UPI000DBE5398|nr:hypothetical protein [Lutibacter citreus]
MEKQLYTCEFCQKKFEPTRRKAQKFCSATCRSKNHHHKNKKSNSVSQEKSKNTSKSKKKGKNQIDKVSTAGVTNAFLGTMASDASLAALKKIFTPEENKPATKGDIQELKNLINTRFFLAQNVNPDPYGKIAYFDIATNKIVYYNEQLQQFELPQFNLK